MDFDNNQPIQTCNLQDDRTGAVRPGAKAVDARAGIALPLHDASGRTRAVVGAAFAEEREIPEDEIRRISTAAGNFPL